MFYRPGVLCSGSSVTTTGVTLCKPEFYKIAILKDEVKIPWWLKKKILLDFISWTLY